MSSIGRSRNVTVTRRITSIDITSLRTHPDPKSFAKEILYYTAPDQNGDPDGLALKMVSIQPSTFVAHPKMLQLLSELPDFNTTTGQLLKPTSLSFVDLQESFQIAIKVGTISSPTANLNILKCDGSGILVNSPTAAANSVLPVIGTAIGNATSNSVLRINLHPHWVRV